MIEDYSKLHYISMDLLDLCLKENESEIYLNFCFDLFPIIEKLKELSLKYHPENIINL
jgi:hypothetical protein